MRIGVDVGGTFVDSVALWPDGRIASAKAPTQPTRPIDGVIASLEATAANANVTLEELLADAEALVHGTTIGLNALLTRSGSAVGLITTRGHEDALAIGRVHQKVAGLRPDQVIRVSELRRPDPLVRPWHIHGIHERMDSRGQAVVTLDEEGVRQAGRALRDAGCAAICVSFLWSMRNPAHERRARELLCEVDPTLRVVLASEVAPVLGEYERTAAAVVNAYLLADVEGYAEALEQELYALGLRQPPWMMLSGGGAAPMAVAASRPVETLGSGPVGGVVAARSIAAEGGLRQVIAADMGGTSFDVSLIVDGRAEEMDVTVVDQLHLAVPTVNVRSIGAGGGSVAWLDADGALHVGPRAAARGIGPACYGLGGLEPTVTDADLLLGRLDPDALLGGRIRLDREAAERAVAPLADALGLGLEETAAGIARVVDAQMTDLVRQMSVERGHDPRQMTLLCFGGAGPLHVGAIAPDLGAERAIVPTSAAVLSALGLAISGWHRTHRRSLTLVAPFDSSELAAAFGTLEVEARDAAPIDARSDAPALERWADMRYRRQTHHVAVKVAGSGGSSGTIDDIDSEALVAAFEARYEQVHGPGTGYAAAGIEIVGLRVIASTPLHMPVATGQPNEPAGNGAPASASARPRSRRAWFDGSFADVPVLGPTDLSLGREISGPVLIDLPTTTVVVHPGQRARVDAQQNIELRWS